MAGELSVEDVADYLLGSLEVSGSAYDDRRAAALRALEWFRRLQGFGFDAIPFFAVHDVGHLLLAGDAFPFRAVTELERWSEAERPLRLFYENRFLNAFRSDARFRRIVQIISAKQGEKAVEEPDPELAARRVDAIVVRALEILFGPARETPLPGTPRLNPVHLRDVAVFDGTTADVARTRFEAKRPGFFVRHLDEFVTRHAPLIDLPRLVREEDFFELLHFEALDRPHRRLFARRVQELSTAAGPIDVARTQVRVESQETTTTVADEGTYPTGGIGEITTHGSIENLVRSELVYRDPNAEIDLFALRWAEGDLLFYTRDSGALHRKRRALVVVLEPARMRIKDPKHVASLTVLAYALIARVAEDLLELFGGEGARIELRLVSPQPVEADREEAELFRLRLREAIRRGDAAVSHHPSVDPATFVDPRRRTFVLAIGDVTLDAKTVERLGGSLLRVSLDAAPGAGTDESESGSVFHLDPSSREPGERIAEVRDAILTRVVGVR